ncbi:MAG: 2-oxo-4-hydroxy-4-carboxy-5-ureidoimidazoline decarboxylase [Bacteroidota bacterium]
MLRLFSMGNEDAAFLSADDLVEMLEDAEEQWFKCSKEDWKEAFAHHPKIGDAESLKKKFASTAQWASAEQSGVNAAAQKTIEALAKEIRSMKISLGISLLSALQGKQRKRCW